jgi:nucleoside-diphosphate-sugar epimerase
MNYLITGGAGFIGSSLADELLERGNYVVVVDNFDPYYSKKLKKYNLQKNSKNKNCKFYELDVRNAKKLTSVLNEENIDVVFHLAARPGVRPSIQNYFIYENINVGGTLSVLKSCLDANVKKIIYASSSSVYGNPVYLPIDESHPTNPISPYGVSKLTGEKYCMAFEQIYGIKAVALRYFTVYGPRQRPDEAICKFSRLIFERKPITIYGNGNQTRDFTYISDIVNGTIFAARKNVSGEIFNLGSGRRISVNALIKIFQEIVKEKIKVNYVDKTKGDVTDTWADIKKAKRTLEYAPTFEIKRGVNEFIKWFRCLPNDLKKTPGSR